MKKTIITNILAVTAMFTATSTLTANEYKHIDSLAVQIQNKTRLLVKETRHYKHTPNYYHMVADTREMARLARHIHEVAHSQGSVYHLESDLRILDRTFHHIEGLFDATEVGSAYGNGHVHGNTKHVKKLLNKIEDCIHHMRDDIAAIRRRNNSHSNWYGPRPIVIEPVRPITPVYGHGSVYGSGWGSGHGSGYGHAPRGISVYGGKYPGSNSGVAIGNGRVSFNIGF